VAPSRADRVARLTAASTHANEYDLKDWHFEVGVDEDLDTMSREQLIVEIRKLRLGTRQSWARRKEKDAPLARVGRPSSFPGKETSVAL